METTGNQAVFRPRRTSSTTGPSRRFSVCPRGRVAARCC